MRIKIIVLLYIFRKNVHVNNINMVYYNKIDVSEGIDANKTNKSNEYDVCLTF